MPVFSQTFTDAKPIYYPANWESGKTALQLYDQFKQSWSFWLVKNFAECFVAGLWIFALFTVLMAIKQMWRLYKMDESNINRLQNQKYIEKEFLLSSGFVASIIIILTIVLFVISDWIRFALLKGLVTFIIIYAVVQGRKLWKQKRQNLNLQAKRDDGKNKLTERKLRREE